MEVSRCASGPAVLLARQNPNCEGEIKFFDSATYDMHLAFFPIVYISNRPVILWQITRFIRFEERDNNGFSPCVKIFVHPDSITNC